jgi:hypothetical protein
MYDILVGKYEGNRPLGRSKRKWKNCDMKKNAAVNLQILLDGKFWQAELLLATQLRSLFLVAKRRMCC